MIRWSLVIAIGLLTGCGNSSFFGASGTSDDKEEDAATEEVTPEEEAGDDAADSDDTPVDTPPTETDTDTAETPVDPCDNPCNGGFTCSDTLKNSTPIEITTLAQLRDLKNDQKYILMADIKDATVTGNTVVNVMIDGNGHTITGLDVGPDGYAGDALGAVLGMGTHVYVKNLNLKNIHVSSGRNSIGGVAGHILGKSCFEDISVTNTTIISEGVSGHAPFIGYVNITHPSRRDLFSARMLATRITAL